MLCLSSMTELSFGTNFGSLEQLIADLWVMLFYHFSLISNVFIKIYDYAN